MNSMLLHPLNGNILVAGVMEGFDTPEVIFASNTRCAFSQGSRAVLGAEISADKDLNLRNLLRVFSVHH
jgi:hypothetical protein